MGTDAVATIEIANLSDLDKVARSPYPWAKVSLLRDYGLFDLLAGARSDDPGLAVVPVRHEVSANGVDTQTAWLWQRELEQVEAAYLERCGHPSLELRALIAAMREINGDDPKRTRLIFRFF